MRTKLAQSKIISSSFWCWQRTLFYITSTYAILGMLWVVRVSENITASQMNIDTDWALAMEPETLGFPANKDQLFNPLNVAPYPGFKQPAPHSPRVMPIAVEHHIANVLRQSFTWM